jgi:hypothetical protein
MKMDLFRTALLLLASVVAVAQQDPASQQPSSSPSGQQSTEVGGATDQDQPLFRGCLSGSEGSYTLKDESGRTYRLHSDKDIKEHVGNMVEIRGTVKQEGADRSEAAAGTPAEREIDVADVKTVASGCDGSAGAAAGAENQSAAATDQAATTPDPGEVASAQEGGVSDESAAALPQTASPLPLIGLIGLASLAVGFAGTRRR